MKETDIIKEVINILYEEDKSTDSINGALQTYTECIIETYNKMNKDYIMTNKDKIIPLDDDKMPQIYFFECSRLNEKLYNDKMYKDVHAVIDEYTGYTKYENALDELLDIIEPMYSDGEEEEWGGKI